MFCDVSNQLIVHLLQLLLGGPDNDDLMKMRRAREDKPWLSSDKVCLMETGSLDHEPQTIWHSRDCRPVQ